MNAARELDATTIHASLLRVWYAPPHDSEDVFESAEMWLVASYCLHWYQRPLRRLLLSMPAGTKVLEARP